jgi:hypothetical protein
MDERYDGGWTRARGGGKIFQLGLQLFERLIVDIYQNRICSINCAASCEHATDATSLLILVSQYCVKLCNEE